MITVVTYWWGTKFAPAYVKKLRAGVARHLQQEHRFVVITDRPDDIDGETWRIPPEDAPLVKAKGCFARLRLFDHGWLEEQDVIGRVVCMDLDMVVTGPLDELFDRAEPFVILQGANATNPCPFNGSLWMFTAGYRPDVWDDFSVGAASRVPWYAFPDDQSWFHHKMPNAGAWKAGRQSGVYAFKKPGWPEGVILPKDARLVAFPGHRDPSQFMHLGWVKEHWR